MGGGRVAVLNEGRFPLRPDEDLCASRNYKDSGIFTGALNPKTQTGRDSVLYTSHYPVPRLQVSMPESSLGS